ncbi:MAG TPA: hypothetical protein VF553_07885 [Pyrinomonadaceae bacterium]|jgi:hypothetical protein
MPAAIHWVISARVAAPALKASTEFTFAPTMEDGSYMIGFDRSAFAASPSHFGAGSAIKFQNRVYVRFMDEGLLELPIKNWKITGRVAD